MAKKRITPRQRRLLAQLSSGLMLRAQKSEPHYFIDGGDAVNERTVKAMLRDGLIRAADDGLFGDAQTLVLVTESAA